MLYVIVVAICVKLTDMYSTSALEADSFSDHFMMVTDLRD